MPAPGDSGSKSRQTPSRRPSQSEEPKSRNIFSRLATVPRPIKVLFDKFPLVTYPACELPSRAPQNRDQHALYIFLNENGALDGGASYNPACLKWQAYLKFSSIDFHTVASSNHASPSGALPFLLPAGAHNTLCEQPKPISSGKLQKWAQENSASAIEESDDVRFEAYMSLVDRSIRRAWLYTLYLTPNFASIAHPLYIESTSTNAFVRASIAHDLRLAAERELLKHGAVIDAEAIYAEAEDAFRALETVLATDQWFFGAERPGLFDASVFAYTHLLLQELGDGWRESRLGNAVRARQRLVRHQERIFETFFK
ncbi:hypothetical protein HDK90DRAFT_489348 [Phyllosticta capitalensis]|uniref:Mitochondrial outer membrane protein n=1 Tax=Phyllosticta capitalensis TaxID=121624 RepID=A0ABR1YK19_9PEZI